MQTADVVVIGGGVMGTSIALHLARRGVKRVILCEKKFIASGPTGRSSALLRRHYTIDLYAWMATRSFEIYSHFEEMTGRPAEITRCGMVLAVGPEDLAAMHETVKMLEGLGVEAYAVTAADLERIVPGINLEGLAGAAYEPGAGYGDPTGVTHAYAARAREMGVVIQEMTEVTGFQVERGQIARVHTTRGDISTRAVVNAAGPWGSRLVRMVGIELPVTPSRQQLAIFRVPASFAARRPIFVDVLQRAYYRPETGNLLLLGTRNPAGAADPADPDSFDEHVDPDRLAWSSEIACHRFPVLAEAEAVGGYASLYDLTPDLHFIIEASPEVPGFFQALGFSGHGFKHSPVIGEIMAQLVCEGESDMIDIAPFSSARFKRGESLRGRYAMWPY